MLTAANIIQANPEFNFQPAKIFGRDGLKGVNPTTGKPAWSIFAGDFQVCAEGPWEKEDFQAALRNLHKVLASNLFQPSATVH